MESLYYFEFCVVILSCCLKINKIKVLRKKKKKKLILIERSDFKSKLLETVRFHAEISCTYAFIYNCFPFSHDLCRFITLSEFNLVQSATYLTLFNF